jgi:hypothetical protein
VPNPAACACWRPTRAYWYAAPFARYDAEIVFDCSIAVARGKYVPYISSAFTPGRICVK